MRARGGLADMRALQVPQSGMYILTEPSVQEEEGDSRYG